MVGGFLGPLESGLKELHGVLVISEGVVGTGQRDGSDNFRLRIALFVEGGDSLFPVIDGLVKGALLKRLLSFVRQIARIRPRSVSQAGNSQDQKEATQLGYFWKPRGHPAIVSLRHINSVTRHTSAQVAMVQKLRSTVEPNQARSGRYDLGVLLQWG